MASIKKEARFLFAESDRNKQVASMVLELCGNLSSMTNNETYGELMNLVDDEAFEIDILLRNHAVMLLHTLATAESSATRIENSILQFLEFQPSSIEDQGEE